jgi:hypothetical protein
MKDHVMFGEVAVKAGMVVTFKLNKNHIWYGAYPRGVTLRIEDVEAEGDAPCVGGVSKSDIRHYIAVDAIEGSPWYATATAVKNNK